MSDSSEAPPGTERQAPRLDQSEVSSAAMSVGRAQVVALAIVGVFALLTLLPHILIWGAPEASTSIFPRDGFLLGGLFVTGVVVHEGIHGLGYSWGGAAWSEIEFGFS
ncbi:MAG: hypothetical protein ABEK84_10605, partial [Salinibacter sp.]